jgi:hypothetical protein
MYKMDYVSKITRSRRTKKKLFVNTNLKYKPKDTCMPYYSLKHKKKELGSLKITYTIDVKK